MVPAGVKFTVNAPQNQVVVTGPKGELRWDAPSFVTIETQNDRLTVKVTNPEDLFQRAMWGTTAAMLQNMLTGVTVGFTKKLGIKGTGYQWKMNGQKLTIEAGYSHSIEVTLPAGITAAVEERGVLAISGIDKQLVGETAAQIRRVRPPEPYKGKGIKYTDEQIRQKAGKQAAKGEGA